MAQKTVFVNLDLLSCLLNYDYASVFLLKAAPLVCDLKESVVFAKLDSLLAIRLLDQLFKRDFSLEVTVDSLKTLIELLFDSMLCDQRVLLRLAWL